MIPSATRRTVLVVCVLMLTGPSRLQGQEGRDPVSAPDVSASEREFFEKEVRPILAERCYSCHSADAERVRGDLLLDSRSGMLEGGGLGPAVVPGDLDQSLLIQAIRYHDRSLRMPPDGRLSPREVEVLEAWVKAGAPSPADEHGSPEPVESGEDISASWWSFQEVRQPDLPPIRDTTWPRNTIDRFVLARLEAEGMRPAPEADRRTLIRRLTFDLTGLPPTPEEVEAFLGDKAPDAFDRLVDRLLASPHYGERWGRHWLDLVRYADTSGCNGDFPMPEAYRYRNYVVDRFNSDLPFDAFLKEQIAGDLLPSDQDPERYEQIIATGYLAISRRFSSLGEEFHLTIDDTIDNLGKAFLGLTISCARCHDHKFDPISQRDYYALYGIFQSTTYAFPGTEIYRHPQHLIPLVSSERSEEELRPLLDRMEELDREIYDTYTLMASLDTGAAKDSLRKDVRKLQDERDELVKSLPEYDQAYGVSEGEPADARIQLKGNPERLGEAVPRGFLTVLGGHRVLAEGSGSGRLELADWITDPKNPLTARVLVNRVWQHHFGQGIVRTPNDFGTRGEPPTHPELLDWLTIRFLEEGWSIKALHREILRSATYRMASLEAPESEEHDPENRLLWTFNRRRLDAEEIRDAMLCVSDALDRSPGGEHPFPDIWKWRYSQHKPFVDDYPSRRRSIYLMQQRIRLHPFLAVFDGADTNASTDLRKISTTPQQALFVLNDEFVHEQARRLADRLAAEETGPAARVDRVFRLAFGRPASEDEVSEAMEYLAQVGVALEKAGISEGERPRAAWASYLRVILGSNEFVFVD
ncbi:PSD1 and planctomycete cytochrome C domain-containing protein [Tautonia rosea]|uniref:PSD1 and planctomycete cytochrome C domain-containing protein n=1 Tax=Tautonia rosea TaxID=2728037 RepID=UPI00147320FB|nr:PSD1 and planctomycete cytochrome C domain-containing protein [Tautonia rosea]